MNPRSEDPKLIIRVINLELVQPMCPRYRNVTDGRTNGRTTYDSNTALALRAVIKMPRSEILGIGTSQLGDVIKGRLRWFGQVMYHDTD